MQYHEKSGSDVLCRQSAINKFLEKEDLNEYLLQEINSK